MSDLHINPNTSTSKNNLPQNDSKQKIISKSLQFAQSKPFPYIWRANLLTVKIKQVKTVKIREFSFNINISQVTDFQYFKL